MTRKLYLILTAALIAGFCSPAKAQAISPDTSSTTKTTEYAAGPDTVTVSMIDTVYVRPVDGMRFGLSTNMGKWAFLGTVNAGARLVLDPMWTVEAAARYNPWTFNPDSIDRRITWRERTLNAGVRLSFPDDRGRAFFLGLGPQWMQFNRGGVFGRTIYEGSTIGGYLKAGWSLPLDAHWSFEAGAALFAGYGDCQAYDCTVCGKKLSEKRGFVWGPDEMILTFVYHF